MADFYRKKPVVIEAQYWNGHNHGEIAAFAGEAAVFSANGDLNIRTMEGNLHAPDGSWIIKGVKGEFYPCDAEVFEATYELVD